MIGSEYACCYSNQAYEWERDSKQRDGHFECFRWSCCCPWLSPNEGGKWKFKTWCAPSIERIEVCIW